MLHGLRLANAHLSVQGLQHPCMLAVRLQQTQEPFGLFLFWCIKEVVSTGLRNAASIKTDANHRLAWVFGSFHHCLVKVRDVVIFLRQGRYWLKREPNLIETASTLFGNVVKWEGHFSKASSRLLLMTLNKPLELNFNDLRRAQRQSCWALPGQDEIARVIWI